MDPIEMAFQNLRTFSNTNLEGLLLASESASLPETNSSHLKIGLTAPKVNDRIPTHPFSRCNSLVSGRVSG